MTAALLNSLKRIISDDAEGGDDEGLGDSNQVKLVDFIIANTNSVALERFTNPHVRVKN